MKLGFTGTQKGLTDKQKATLVFLLDIPDITEFHHGDCKGADEQAHGIVQNRGDICIHIHPPENPRKRAFCGEFGVIYDEKKYLERNHDIVDMTDAMIAMPSGLDEELRSGTWATIRYAKKKGKKCMIIFPDGSQKLA